MRDGRVITKTFADALWSWRKVKAQTETVGSSIEKGTVSYLCSALPVPVRPTLEYETGWSVHN